ncbi:homeobox-domain-containing protein [Suillus decipiens]|nr:homeobox-domain-containing protein [Suillus decipiens]
MTNPRDDRLFSNLSKARKSPPGGDSQNNSGFFQTGQGGRTVLPPLSSAFPTSPSSVPNYPSYSQQRSSPGKSDHSSSSYGQWPTIAPQHSSYYEHYDRYPQTQYPSYPSRSSPTIPADSHGSRKLPPLNMPDRYQGNYGAVAPLVSNYGDIRSPTATYPTEYAPYPNQTSYSYPPVPDPRHHSSQLPSVHHSQQMSIGMYPPDRGMPTHVEAHGPSPYARGPITNTALTQEPTPMMENDQPAIKKKRKRADAAQLKVLNETYARTAFPSTEERAELAKKLDMSARSVQIWFQNKRQSMRQTTRQSSASADEVSHPSFGGGGISPTSVSHTSYITRPSQDARPVAQDSRSSIPHRREEDPRKWQQPGRY